jgi:hypothetical protein
METFSQVSVADQILGGNLQTPGSSIQVPPPRITPESGIAYPAPNLIFERQGASSQGYCVSVGEFMGRIQYRKYIGGQTTGVNTYPFVLSDTVPMSRYWGVLEASIIRNGADPGAGALPVGLWMIPPGKLPMILNPDGGTDPNGFFGNYNGPTASAGNGPPPKDGIRIDQLSDIPQVIIQGQELSAIKAGIQLVPPGWTLMAYISAFGTAASPNAAGDQLELRISFAEMTTGEDMSQI